MGQVRMERLIFAPTLSSLKTLNITRQFVCMFSFVCLRMTTDETWIVIHRTLMKNSTPCHQISLLRMIIED